jgi:hypothetical protein
MREVWILADILYTNGYPVFPAAEIYVIILIQTLIRYWSTVSRCRVAIYLKVISTSLTQLVYLAELEVV